MRWSSLLAVLVVVGCGSPAPVDPAADCNLVILSIDTLRADHLGLYGYHRETSPALDDFARRAAVFDQAITVHATTAPSHATVFTGRYPGSHGIQKNGMSLLPDIPTLAQLLDERGWATGGFISGWTLQRHTELDRGFAVYDDRLGDPRYGAGARREGQETTDAAVAWLEHQVAANRRFFLFLHLFEPHWPYEPPVSDALRFLPDQTELTTWTKPLNLARLLSLNRLDGTERREFVARYDGEIVVADRLFGRLLDTLEDLKVARNTVVVVLSDHGETLFERPWAMDHGTRPYEEQVRVPLIVFIPDDPSRGRRVPDQVSLVDVFPTVLEIFDVDPPGGVQGRSLLGLARGQATDSIPRPAFITARADPARVPQIEAPVAKGALVRAIRLPELKLIEYPTTSQGWYPELFELEADPGELVNLARTRNDRAVLFHDHLERWESWAGATGELAPLELDPEVEAALRQLGYIDD